MRTSVSHDNTSSLSMQELIRRSFYEPAPDADYDKMRTLHFILCDGGTHGRESQPMQARSANRCDRERAMRWLAHFYRLDS